jgi:hypothetical protein
MRQHGPRSQAELLQSEIPAPSCQLSAPDMAAHFASTLTILERHEHEHIRLLIVPTVYGTNAVDHFVG